MSELLFVYGTLKRGFGLNVWLERLQAEFKTEGVLPGYKLYTHAFGPYPVIKAASKEESRVYGEVYELPYPELAFFYLNQIESEYDLTRVTVNEDLSVLTYVFCGELTERNKLIPSGKFE